MIRIRIGIVGFLLCVVFWLGGCATGGSESGAIPPSYQAIADKLGVDLENLVQSKSGMAWVIRQKGSGKVPQTGQRIRVHYTGYLLDGTKFDSSIDRGQPLETRIGLGYVIQGWDIAFTEMPVGEKRVLFIPPELAYGRSGAGKIPPNATLVFDVELLEIVR